ncbi:MAG: hypothetical protein N3E48_00280 [Candidatus Bathyarchaeota archaeon]|nr:hypothetical protein [Candidatus Bathyarchaeota archaeon]
MKVEDAILVYNYCEKIKSELIILFNLIEEASNVKAEDVEGARKIVLAFFNALIGEVRCAKVATGLKDFSSVEFNLMECLGCFNLKKIKDAEENIGKTLTTVTTICYHAVKTLKDKNLIP